MGKNWLVADCYFRTGSRFKFSGINRKVQLKHPSVTCQRTASIRSASIHPLAVKRLANESLTFLVVQMCVAHSLLIQALSYILIKVPTN